MQSPSQSQARIEKASFRQVLGWQRRVFAAMSEGDNDGLVVSGPTAESIAYTLLDLLAYYYPHHEGIASFQPAPGVHCGMQGMTAFVQQFHSIEM
jgi:hypothetical protein